MYILGIGRTKFGVLPESIPEMMYESIYKALNDANMEVKELNAIFVSNFIGDSSYNQAHLSSIASTLLPDTNLPSFRVEAACAGGGVALHLGLNTLHKYKNILVIGVEKMTDLGSMESLRSVCSATDLVLEQKEGLVFPAAGALVSQQYMKKNNVLLKDLNLVALKNHENANLNPYAHFYGKKVTEDMINNSPIICSPLRLFDCSPNSDGAASVIISNEKRNKRAVKVAASEMATGNIHLAIEKDITHFPATRIAGEKAYKAAGITPKEINFAEIHDGFTAMEMSSMEDLKLCKPGKAKELVRNGITKLNGELPINMDGGLKANGHPIGATGIAQVYELVTQLRGEAKKRQVPGNIGLSYTFGALVGSASVHILRG